MRGISIETLARLRNKPHQDAETVSTLDWLINAHCKELQEPWMTLEEFLKSGFEGLCWIALTNKFVFECTYQGWDFIARNGCVNYESITHVIPIHKPEPPK